LWSLLAMSVILFAIDKMSPHTAPWQEPGVSLVHC